MTLPKRKLTRAFYLQLIGGTTIAFALVGFLWISSEYRRFHRESKHLRDEYRSAQKERLQYEVENVVEFIEFKRSQIEERLKRDIRNRVGEAVQIARNIHARNRDTRSDEEIQSVQPGLRVLFMSGCTSDIIVDRGILDDGVDFLAKPFTMESLAAKVREVLDRPV